MRDGRMHQTTVRFGPDLWAALEEECRHLGVSAAHFVREATLARLSYTAGRRGEPEYEHALVGAGAPHTDRIETGRDRTELQVHTAADIASESGLDAAAVTAQAELVRTRSQRLREDSERMRHERASRKAEKSR